MKSVTIDKLAAPSRWRSEIERVDLERMRFKRIRVHRIRVGDLERPYADPA